LAALDAIRSWFGGARETALVAPEDVPKLASGGPSAGTVVHASKLLQRSRFVIPGDDKDPALYSAALREAEYGRTRRLYGFYEAARSRDSRLARVCATRNAAISARDFTMEPASQSDHDKRVAAAVDKMLRAVPNFQGIMGELNDAQLTGLSVGEHNWRVDDDGYFTSHPTIHQTSLFDWDGYRPAISDGGSALIPLDTYAPEKFIIFSPTSGFPAAPYRRGALQAAVPMSLLKRHVITWWASALERYGQPQLIGTVPNAAPSDVKEEVARLLREMSSQGGAAFSEGIAISAINGASIDPELHLNAVDFANKEMAIAVLAQNLTTEIMQGSHAAASIARLVQIDVQLSDVQQIEYAITQQWVRWLVQFNFPGSACPFFRLALSTPEPFTLDEYSKNLCTEDEYRTARGYGPKEVAPDTTSAEAIKEPLNGAQAAQAQEVVKNVAAGLIPRESGVALLEMSLLVSTEQAEKIMGSAGSGFIPKAAA
jgi:phage gp29-like protein